MNSHRRIFTDSLGIRLSGFLVAMFVAATVGACGQSDSDANQGTLVVYSGRSETLVDPIIRQFADATGIDVEVRYAGTAALAATLLEEGDRTSADLFFAQDPSGLAVVDDMLAPLPEELLELVPQWARSEQGRWVGISGRARVLVYNTERLSEADLPDDLTGLTDPKWKGRLGWAPTNGSFQAMVTAMRSTQGRSYARDWLIGMMANEPKVYPKNTPQVAAAAAGEIDIGLVNHYYLHRFLAEEGESFKARNHHLPGGGPGAMVMVAGAGILQSSDNHENATKLIEFMLSVVGQQYFASQTFEYPLVDEVTTHPLLLPLEEINNPGITPNQLADLEGTQSLMREVGIIP